MSDKLPIGSVGWRDLTVPDAVEIGNFYQEVVGWTSTPTPVDDYEDYTMWSSDGKAVAGICHAKGSNAKIPPQWLVYITVEDVDSAAAICRDLGGKVLDGPRDMGGGRFAVIQDPAGAVSALYTP